MNAQQHLWKRLAQLLPADQLAKLKQQYVDDCARDRRQSEYNTWCRRRNEAAHVIRTAADLGTVKRAQVRLIAILTWLEKHQDWDRE